MSDKQRVIIILKQENPKTWMVTMGEHPVEFEFVGVELTTVMTALGSWVFMNQLLKSV